MLLMSLGTTPRQPAPENCCRSYLTASKRRRATFAEAHEAMAHGSFEAKGCGSLQPMHVNYFIAILGELLQRINDPGARYSIALPDMKQYRGLWAPNKNSPKNDPILSSGVVRHAHSSLATNGVGFLRVAHDTRHALRR
jgi:hypothetical protein